MDAAAMKARLRADLRDALRARRALEVRVLRALVAALDDAEAVPAESRPASLRHRFGDGSAEVARRVLSEAEIGALLREEVEGRLNAAAEMDRLRRSDRADALRSEAAVARRYLG